VFDQFDNKLKKLDVGGKPADANHRLPQLVQSTLFHRNESLMMVALCDLADSAKGIYVFVHYGAFKRRIDLKDGAAWMCGRKAGTVTGIRHYRI
jgi:hypothetical protein